MKEIYVNQIKERDRVSSIFLVRDKITAMAKNGKPYMTLKLMDSTGEVEAKVWDRIDELSSHFDADDFIRIEAKASVYMGKMQLIVQQLDKVADDAVDIGDFLPVSSRSAEEMRNELDQLLDSLENPYIRDLLRSFFDDPRFYRLYSRAPAAKSMHHTYIGGLLEHSLAVAALALDVAKRYPQVDRDLLISGAMLHDVGKVQELSFDRSFGYTDEGKLLGHIVMGVQMIEDHVRAIPGFPVELSMMIKHLLLSHHGQYDFGSPKRPKFLEAVILNFIDDLDSKINAVQLHVEKEQQDHGWTSYHRLFDRYFYMGQQNKPERQQPPGDPKVVPPAATPASRQPSDRQRDSRYERPLGATLGEQLKSRNLDLFTQINDKGEPS
ncbi:HD domain-containing protein [Pelovirga terrestris]|uniref:HD domain-containing protein n=1 Tax=Pelovirga terrestris TaxID=2771352 RepID=A0A8J6QP64_9BACT|nr:HD domain-containing protein [Pelovirga terrestris]